MDPLTLLEADLLNIQCPDANGRLGVRVKQVLRPKATSIVTEWQLDRLLGLVERLLHVEGNDELRTLCYILVYKLAYHLHHHPDLTKGHVDGVLRLLQRQMMDPAQCIWWKMMAVVYTRLYGFGHLDTLLLSVLHSGPPVREILLPTIVALLCPHHCSYAKQHRPDWLAPGRVVTEPLVLSHAQRIEVRRILSDAFPYRKAGPVDQDLVAAQDAILCLGTMVLVLPLWCLFVAPSVYTHPLAPWVVLHTLEEHPDAVLTDRRLLTRCLSMFMTERPSILWLAVYYRAFGMVPRDWVSATVFDVEGDALDRSLAVLYAHHFGHPRADWSPQPHDSRFTRVV